MIICGISWLFTTSYGKNYRDSVASLSCGEIMIVFVLLALILGVVTAIFTGVFK